MKKERTTILVLKSFDGLNAIVIDEIERIVQTGGYRDRKGRPQIPPKSVSYKGKVCDVFRLNNGYCDVRGDCISVD